MHLGIDLGTGSVKVMAVLEDGRELHASRAYGVGSPLPGYAETDCAEWLRGIREAWEELARGLGPRAVDSIGLSGQMHGVVALSLAEGPVAPAILWADQRGKDCLGRIFALPEGMRERLMNFPAAGMAAATMLWLKENRPETYAKADLFLFPKDYVRWALTGSLATDYSDASGSLLYDFREGAWYGELLERLGLDAGKLPPIRGSAELAGAVSASGASLTGLPKGAPVAVGAGDTPAALLGSGLSGADALQVSIGTGSQVARLCATLPPYDPALNLFESTAPGYLCRVAAMLNGGLALERVRSLFGRTWREIYGEIEGRGLAPPLDLMFLPYLGGERCPYMNPDARGGWSGLGLHHEWIDLVHAALLGVACSVRLGAETIGRDGVERFRFVGGSSKYPYWNSLLASVLGSPLEVCDRSECSALGAVILGACATGREIPVRAAYSRVEPRGLAGIDDYYARFKETYRALYGSGRARP
jgi:xylulokinase